MTRKASIAALILLSGYAPARAEQADHDPVARCADQSGTAELEIACLRGVIRALLSGESVDAVAATANSTEPDAVVAATPAPAEPVAMEAAAPEALPAAAPTGMGAEQVMAREASGKKSEKKERKEDGEHARVVDFAYASTGQLILVLDNGQVWGQRSSDNQSVRLQKDEKTPVFIRRGALSGYRIDFTEKHRTITAERLK